MVNYKGFVITPSYMAGSNFRIVKGITVPRVPTKADIEYWEIYDPMERRRHGAEDSLQECKDRIDALLQEMGMKDNLPDTWAALEKEVIDG